MDKKKNVIIAILVVFLLVACGFICYDKLLKKEEKESCTKTECKCDKCGEAEKTDERDSNYSYTISNLSSKYINSGDPSSYITFDTKNSTWKANRNACHAYETIEGTFSIENNEITLKYSDGSNKAILKIIGNYNFGEYAGILYETYSENESFAGCTTSGYYVIDK